VAVLVAVFAVETAVADWQLEKARVGLDAGRLSESVWHFEEARRWAPPGFQSSLWFSRTLLASARARNRESSVLPVAIRFAADACRDSEDRANACYYLAMLHAGQGRTDEALRLLRECETMAPAWYVPYWASGIVYISRGNDAPAEEALAHAAQLAGKHGPEMIRILESIRAHPRPVTAPPAGK
jgi:cytochrome c-type biogenesis protein CcmH/NrfG